MEVQELVTMLREAGATRRCHTFPHHGEYRVDTHSFGMLTLLLALWPTCRKELMVAVIGHDLPERWVGDMPAPTKWAIGGDAAKQLDMLETRIIKQLGLQVTLSTEERDWLEGLDRVELLLWSKEQLALGNLNATLIVNVLLERFKQKPLPKPLHDFVENHKWHRTPDKIPT